MIVQAEFFGSDYVRSRDAQRLTDQQSRVYDVMKDDAWRSDPEIAEEIMRRFGRREKESSVARQRRYLKRRLTDATIESRHDGNGLYRHRLRRIAYTDPGEQGRHGAR